MFPAGAPRGMTRPRIVRRARAELAGRHRHGDAGDRRGAGGASRRAPGRGGAGGVRRRLRRDARRRRRGAAARVGHPRHRRARRGAAGRRLRPRHPVHQLVRQRAGGLARRHRRALGLSPRLARPAADAGGRRPHGRGADVRSRRRPTPESSGRTTAPTTCGSSPAWACRRSDAPVVRCTVPAAAHERAAALLAEAGVAGRRRLVGVRARRRLRSAKRWPPERVAEAIAGARRRAASAPCWSGRPPIARSPVRYNRRSIRRRGPRSSISSAAPTWRTLMARAGALRGRRRQRFRGDARGLGGRAGRWSRSSGRPTSGRRRRWARTRSCATTCGAGRACCARVRSITGACAGSTPRTWSRRSPKAPVTPAVFLDRDGTIIDDVGYLDRVDRRRHLPVVGRRAAAAQARRLRHRRDHQPVGRGARALSRVGGARRPRPPDRGARPRRRRRRRLVSLPAPRRRASIRPTGSTATAASRSRAC